MTILVLAFSVVIIPNYSNASVPSTNYKINECVVLLHGLARTNKSFAKMSKSLKLDGYDIVNFDYPSRKHTIEVLSDKYVSKAVTQCRTYGPKRIHFVTHSLGGILVRHFLSQNQIEELGHIVMLSPPNKGSEIVDKLGDIPGFFLLNGPAGLQLGTSKQGIPNRLGPVTYPVGVITGNKSINLILSLLIPGDDDGKVSIEKSKVEGMTEFLVVPHAHPFIMDSDEVIRQTTTFLQKAKFIKQN